MDDLPTPGGELLYGDALLRVLTDDGRDVPYLHFQGARVDEGHIHLYQPNYRTALAAEQDVRLSSRCRAASDDIGIAVAVHRDVGIIRRYPARAVAESIACISP